MKRMGAVLSHSDPFGLKVCFKGSKRQVRELKAGLEEATGTRISIDDNNCVSSFEPTEAQGFENVQTILADLVGSETVFTLQYADEQRHLTSYFGEELGGYTAGIIRSEVGRRWYRSGSRLSCMLGGSGYAYYSLPGLIAHELLGHGSGVVAKGRPASERAAVKVENAVHSARGEPTRCR